jgi:hypothetical protein
LKAGVEQAQAAYRGSLAQYERTVLTAYQEVEDQLAALHFLDNESQSESSAVSDARKAEQIAMQRYKPGLAGYLDVVYAQQSVLTNEQTADRSAVKVGRVSCADQRFFQVRRNSPLSHRPDGGSTIPHTARRPSHSMAAKIRR